MNKQICPACQGRKAIQAGNVTLGCPFCAGEGTVEDVDRKPFWYVVNPPAAIGAAGVVNVPLNIDARADFELFCLVATSTGAFTCEITESSGRVWQNAPVNNANQFGTAVAPFVLVIPIRLPARGSLNFRLTDTSAAPNTVQIVLFGFELYPLA